MIPVAVELPAAPVRPARPGDAHALFALSRTFVGSGELRSRPLGHYRARAEEFLLVEDTAPGGGLAGCVGVRDEGYGDAVLHNFCVARGSQGRGIGSALLRDALERVRGHRATRVFTATTGPAVLFVRHGFAPVEPEQAPAAWAAALDPARGSRVYVRTL
ncbi:GNAT family N-acetyltransferase [Streptomyces erythrochromogenes]|uniref:GNAT family N-acetyltransferase n=1 Tax=Streptomyces erythrochromogenes TaxID=285574 RepID=UPI0036FF2AAB